MKKKKGDVAEERNERRKKWLSGTHW